MDTSTDDLFADMDRSNQAAAETGNSPKDKTNAAACVHRFRAFDEELKVKIWRHEQWSNALVFEISMTYRNIAVGSPVQFVSPWCQLLSSFEGKAALSWPPVQPCVLLCKPIPATDQNKATLPVFPVSTQWREFFKLHQTDCDSIPLVWLLSFSNGTVYYFVRDSAIRYAALLSLPCCEPVSLWAWMESPVTSKLSSTSPAVVEGVLISLSGSGAGVAMWLPTEGKQTTSYLRVTEFRPPVAPSPVCDTRAHGSWLHLLTTSGHLLSIHISFGRKTNNEASLDEWKPVCQPGNFPRLPTHMIPALSVTDQMYLTPKWRYFDLRGFVRMSDGHLGGQLSTGEKIRLVDLLCGHEIAEPQSIEKNSDSLLGTVTSLVSTHSRLRAYRALLRLLGFLDADDESPNLSTGSEAPVKRFIDVQMHTSTPNIESATAIGSPPFELSIDIYLQVPSSSRTNTLLTPTTPLQSLSFQELASLLLDPESPTSFFEQDLLLTVKLTPITYPTTGCKKDAEGLPIFTYSEPWFLQEKHWVRADTPTAHLLRRRLVLPPDWHTCLGSTNGSNSFNSLRLDVSLGLEPPMLPTSLFFSDLAGQQKQPYLKSYRINAPPIFTNVGCFHLDRVHWLCPLDAIGRWRQPLDHAYVHPAQSMLAMGYILDSLDILWSLLLDICKSPNHPSLAALSKYSSSNSIKQNQISLHGRVEGQLSLCFLPTDRHAFLSWSYAIPSKSDELTKMNIELTFSSHCPHTLWLIHGSLTRRFQSSVHKGSDSPLPSVEDLRQDYSILKSIGDSLRQRPLSSDDQGKQREFRKLLQAFCTIRNTSAVRSALGR